MDMNLLYTVKQLGDARAAQGPPALKPPRVSLRQRTAEAIASHDADLHEKQMLNELDPIPTHEAYKDMQRRRDRKLTRQELDDACSAILDTWTGGTESDTDTEREDELDAEAARLNGRVRQLWRRHAPTAAERERRKEGGGYVDGLPAGDAGSSRGPAPRVQRRKMARWTGLAMCTACRAQGLGRCSRMTMRGWEKEEGLKVCERCRRTGEVCKDEEEERRRREGREKSKEEKAMERRAEEEEMVRKGKVDVFGGRIGVVDGNKFAPPRRCWYDDVDEE